MSTLKLPLGERDHVRGDLDAPLLLVEYGDFECPFCGRAFPVVRAIERALGDRLCVGFRNFPLTAHPHALQAAEAADAAGAQGRFWEMHNLLFQHQDALEIPDLIEYAKTIDLDTRKFLEDLRNHTRAGKIAEDLRSGAISGVNGTPTFFINGMRHEGNYDFESLMAALTGGVAAWHEL